MSKPTQKREVGLLDGTPEKRLYWSIISDYDLQTGICELVDNAIDVWLSRNSNKRLVISLSLDAERQLIRVYDNAGGVEEQDLRLLVAPGASNNAPESESIGIFGVGSKRAVVALAQAITIKTRSGQGKSLQLDIDDDWLQSTDWHLPHFEIPDIEPGVTAIALSALRTALEVEDVDELIAHLEATYGVFLQEQTLEINVNDVPLAPRLFEAWAYPPEFQPRQAEFQVAIKDYAPVRVQITAGLISDRDPAEENYGVYFYCNNRLIVGELKSREVGYFITSEAGVPHPDASLCRAIVKINGSARLMPWNSSKAGINFDHEIFHALRPTLIQLVSHFSSLSRRLKNDWERSVFRYGSGEIAQLEPIEAGTRRKLVLPPLPKVNKKYAEVLRGTNKNQINDQPWTLGLVESMAAVDIISKQHLETKNRIALILLDSNFEIALKEFIVHRPDLFPVKSTDIPKLFSARHLVIAAVAAHVPFPKTLLAKVKHYYELRNKLIHERATVNIGDADIENYQETVETVLAKLFGLRF